MKIIPLTLDGLTYRGFPSKRNSLPAMVVVFSVWDWSGCVSSLGLRYPAVLHSRCIDLGGGGGSCFGFTLKIDFF